MSPLFGKTQKQEDPVSTLARCITYLDDARAYRRKDVEQIEKAFSELKKTRFKEHYDLWIKVRPFAEKIADMPMKVEGVPRMIRAIAWVKVLDRIGVIFVILFIALQIVPAWKRILGPDALGGDLLLYSIISVLVVVALLNVATALDYLIRKRIIAYEDATMDEYSPAREKMKEGVGRMMKSLAKEANKSGNKSEDFSMVLYFDDYDNTKVIKQWKPAVFGVFKKKYNHYQVVPTL